MVTWSPLNCFSLLQSLKAVTRTTMITAIRMATPSIQSEAWSSSSGSETQQQLLGLFSIMELQKL